MRQFLTLCLGTGLIFCVLVLPNHPRTMTWSAFNLWPLELPFILLLMVALGRLRGLATIIALLLVVATLVKIADYGTFAAYNRTFNPIVDTFLINAGFGLLTSSLGLPLALALTFLSIAALILLFVLLRIALKAWANVPSHNWMRGVAAAGVLMTGTWAVADVGHHLKHWRFEDSPPGTAWTLRLIYKRGVEMQATATDLRQFRQNAQSDPMLEAQGLLDKLEGRDVLLVWIESYGRASFDNPLYAQTHQQTLLRAEAEIQATGMTIRSGWLTSPTAGGESWMAHGTLATGLWTSDNGRYNAMIASGRKWLFHYARKAGYQTVVFMPAITLAWPESSAMGFDHVFAAADIPYKGKRFNWVTMPDQFTLSAYQDLLPQSAQPRFVQVALISSHASWTPVPQMIPWEDIGDGTVFDPMAQQGPTPRELWKDRDAVRDAYRRSVDYSLQAVFSHVANLGAQAPLIIVAGDHQAAGFVAGSDNRDVPFHVIGPPEVMPHIAHWGLNDGILPSSNGPVRRMDRFRDDFLNAFSSFGQLAKATR